MWKGRIIGALIGFFLLNIIGAIIGGLIGYYYFDKPRIQASYAGGSVNNAQLIPSLFRLMGYVARGAGRVNEQHIQIVEQFMNLMQLSPDLRQVAIEAFNQGKDPAFNVNAELARLRELTAANTMTRSSVLEVLVQVALSDEQLSDEEHRRLLDIAEGLGVSRSAMEQLIRLRFTEMRFARARAQGGYSQGGYSQSGYGQGGYSQGGYQEQGESGGQYQQQTSADELKQAYELLGVKETDSFEVIKKAHKRLMLKYHPDRLASQGLSPEMVRVYTQKAQNIQAAFDLIKKHLGK